MSGLGRAWVRESVRKAKEILTEVTSLTPQDRDYLNLVIGHGEAFLRLTSEDQSKVRGSSCQQK